MRPLIALALLALALGGGFLIAAIKTLTTETGLDW